MSDVLVYIPTGYGQIPAVFSPEDWDEIYDAYKKDNFVEIAGDETVTATSYIELNMTDAVHNCSTFYVGDQDHLDACRDLANQNADFMENLCFCLFGEEGMKMRFAFCKKIREFCRQKAIMFSQMRYTGLGKMTIDLEHRSQVVEVSIKYGEDHNTVYIRKEGVCIDFGEGEKNLEEELQKVLESIVEKPVVSQDEDSSEDQDEGQETDFADFDAAMKVE